MLEALQQLSFIIIAALQSLSPALDGVMKAITSLGRAEFYLVLLTFIYLAYDHRLGFRLILLLIFTDMVGMVSKLLFHQPRPYWLRPELKISEETTYGIPSTHASSSMAIWGYLAYKVNKTWLWIVVGLMVFFIALSRLYLGVHFLHDVLFGWLIGLVMILISVTCEKPVASWAAKLSLGMQVFVALVASIAFILIGQLVNAWISRVTDPEQWRDLAAQARSINYSIILAGSIFGTLVGYALMHKFAPFSTQGKWGLRLARFAIGLLGVLVIYFGLDVIFGLIASGETVLGLVLRFIRYGTVNFWVTFLAPWLFLKVRLADRE
jgi:membrane-associated phospholipid phosphatase